jgi:hypothetical protein
VDTVPLIEFARVGVGGDGRITVNLQYVISLAPDPAAADRTVVRITTGRGFEEYTVVGGYDRVMADVRRALPGDGGRHPGA